MEDIERKMAKPLFFHNPVYTMVNRDNPNLQQVKRPTLIPLSQFNTSKETTLHEEGKKFRKGSKKKKHGGGILNKISGLARKGTRKHPSEDSEVRRGSIQSR
uniref:Uncharacterized protein n=1 Tax=Ciona savignyi TaxID=51511 RepID=H2Z291_CIOSA